MSVKTLRLKRINAQNLVCGNITLEKINAYNHVRGDITFEKNKRLKSCPWSNYV